MIKVVRLYKTLRDQLKRLQFHFEAVYKKPFSNKIPFGFCDFRTKNNERINILIYFCYNMAVTKLAFTL